MHTRKAVLWASIACTALGLVFLLVGTAGPYAVQEKLDKTVAKAVRVPKKGTDDYDDWLTNRDPDDPVHIMSYYFFNITNPEHVLAGGRPHVEEVGPYRYKKWYERFEVEFFDDDDKVRFYEWDFKEWIPDSKDPQSDIIYQVNPVYQKILAQAGSEAAIVASATASGLEVLRDSLLGDFLSKVSVLATPDVLLAMRDGVQTEFVHVIEGKAAVGTVMGVVQATGDAQLPFNGVSELPLPHGGTFMPLNAWEGHAAVNVSHEAVGLLLFGEHATKSPGWTWDIEHKPGLLQWLHLVDTGDHEELVDIYQLDSVDDLLLIAEWASEYLLDTLADEVVPDRVTLASGLFDAQWANISVVPGGVSDGEGPLRVEAGLFGNLDLDPATVAELWNKHNAYSFASNGIGAWLPQPRAAALMHAFGISQDDVSVIAQWLGNFVHNIAPPRVLHKFSAVPGVHDWSDLAYLQWGTMLVTDHVSVRDLPGGDALPGYPEFNAWATHVKHDGSLALSVDQAKSLLTGTLSLTVAENLGFFYQAPVNAVVHRYPLLSATNVGHVREYLQYIGKVFVLDATILPALHDNAGFIVAHSAHDWLYGFEDAMYNLLLNTNELQSIVGNQTSREVARGIKKDAYFTGKDEDTVDMYYEWEGRTTITHWASDETITGTEGVQFSPNMDLDDRFPVWSEDIFRQVYFSGREKITTDGVHLYHTTLGDDVLASQEDVPRNAKYYQAREGMANLTAVHGARMFFSRPMFLKCDPMWAAAIDGMPDGDMSTHDTFLDIEPITGFVFHGRKRLQLSQDVSATDLFFPHVASNLVPFFWAEEASDAPEKSVKKFKDRVYGALRIKRLMLQVGLGLGVSLTLIGAALYVYMRKAFTKHEPVTRHTPAMATPGAAYVQMQ